MEKFIFFLALLAGGGLLCAVEEEQNRSLDKEVAVRLVLPNGQPGPIQMVPTVIKTPAEWLDQLGRERYEVLRNQGTEPPFCGNLTDHAEPGIYFCAGCDLPLFTSLSKFHSGTGWPSFFAPFAKENILERVDRSHGMIRTEILCVRCGGHLGHVFSDGPPPTRLRYCLNGKALVFRPTAHTK
jgi:methionine-R-sulfoxide reductase